MIVVFKILAWLEYFDQEIWALVEARWLLWELSQYQIWIFHAKIESGTEFQASSTNRTFLLYTV